MAGKSDIVRRVSYRTESAFGDAAPVAGDTWKLAPLVGDATGDETQEFDSEQEQSTDGLLSEEVATVSGGVVSYKTRFPTGLLALDEGGDAAPGQCYHQEVYESHFGNAARTYAGGTIDVDTDSTHFEVTPTPAVGEIIMLGAGTNTPEVFAVISVTGAEVTLDHPVATAANRAVGAPVYGSFGFNAPAVPVQYAPVIWYLFEYSDEEVLFGPGQVSSLSFDSFTSKQGLRLNVEAQMDNSQVGFVPSADPVEGFTGGSLVGVSSPVHIDGVDTEVRDFNITFGVLQAEREATKGARGRVGYEKRGTECTGKLTEYFNVARKDDWRNGTKRPLLAWCPIRGASNLAIARGGIAAFIPNAQLFWSKTTSGGLRTQDLNFKALRPTVAQRAAGLFASVYFATFGGIAGAP